jgi:hypothetical protein
LARSAEFLLNGARVMRAIYLGADDTLEETVALWAQSLVGPNPSDTGLWARAADVIACGTAEQIDAFVRNERSRLRLKVLERLPAENLRTVEMFGDQVAVLVHDKALLDEEDIASAGILVYGKSAAPLIKQIGRRWFLTPGPLGCRGGGIFVLDDSESEVVATVYGADGQMSGSEILRATRATKLSVQE